MWRTHLFYIIYLPINILLSLFIYISIIQSLYLFIYIHLSIKRLYVAKKNIIGDLEVVMCGLWRTNLFYIIYLPINILFHTSFCFSLPIY